MKLNLKLKNRDNVYLLPIEKIRLWEDAPRKSFDNYKLSQLAESIRANGVLQPLVVVSREDGYTLYSGIRRYKAALLVGLTSLPCLVYKEDTTPRLIPLLESHGQCPLNIFEEAEGISALLESGKLTPLEVAEKLGTTPNGLEEQLKMLNFTDAQRSSILRASLEWRHLKSLIRLRDDLQRAKALDYVIAKGMTQMECEKYVDSLLNPQKPQPSMGQNTAFYLDSRVLDNTFRRVVTNVQKAGFTLDFTENEDDLYKEYVFRIPKQAEKVAK